MTQRKGGVLITTELYGTRTFELSGMVGDKLVTEATEAARKQAGMVAEMIREAYARGLSDGFAQGVVAREQEKES